MKNRHILILITVVLLSGCESPVHTSLIAGKPPKFTFNSPREVNGLVIFHIPKEHENDAGFGSDVITDANVVWEINGDLKSREISYGTVPPGMTEKTTAKPLIEDGHYLVWCSQDGNGGCTGTVFVMREGAAYEPK